MLRPTLLAHPVVATDLSRFALSLLLVPIVYCRLISIERLCVCCHLSGHLRVIDLLLLQWRGNAAPTCAIKQ